MTDSLNITVIGTGYVGLVSGVCFAEIGHRVTCVDSNSYKVQQLQNGTIPIYEPGLEEMVLRNAQQGRLFFSDQLAPHLPDADVVLIAVGTPTAADGVSADLSAIYAVARGIAPHLSGYTVVTTKSTVPVLTNARVEEIIRELNPKAHFDICSNPEFLREGSAIGDFMKPDRIVTGTRSKKAAEIMDILYAPLTAQGAPHVHTTPESAELIKYAANSYLAAKVAFINEVADLAEKAGGDIDDIARGIGLDTRIGPKFLQAGPGFGGSCFPKDMRAFAHMARDHHVPSRIIEAVIESNDTRKRSMATRIINALNGNVNAKKIAILGVTFKANTDDMRESVSLDIIPQLLQAGAEIHAYDPEARHQAHELLPQSVFWHDKAEDVFTDAHAIVLLTDWDEFKKIDLKKAKRVMKGNLFIDLRNFLDRGKVTDAGFTYLSIGRTADSPNVDPNLRIVQS